jgi:type I restriction enzyme S subunit
MSSTAQHWKYLQFVEFRNLGYWDYFTNFKKVTWTSAFPVVELRDVLTWRKGSITIDNATTYKRCRVQLYGKGVVLRDEAKGTVIKTKKQQLCRPHDFLVAEIDAKYGGYGIVPPELDGAIVSGHYFLFEIDQSRLLPEFLGLIVKQRQFAEQVQATGSTNYAAIRAYHVLEYKIPLPSLLQQASLVADYHAKTQKVKQQREEAESFAKSINAVLFKELGLEIPDKKKQYKGFQFIESSKIREWGFDKIMGGVNYSSSLWPSVSFDDMPTLADAIYRGKSPVYDAESEKVILNQKCVRWNEIEIKFAKSVSAKWLSKTAVGMLTMPGDILVNSTGEGTIGRAAVVDEKAAGYLFDSHVLLIRINQNQVNPNLLAEIINSPHGQNQINDLKSAQSTKQTELGVANLKKLLFPLPPLVIQNQIAAQLRDYKHEGRRLRAAADTLEAAALVEFEAEVFQAN